MKTPLITVIFLLLHVLQLRAFPPSPFYTLYGTVRDEVGNVLTAEDAKIVLIKGSEVVQRAPITSGVRLDQNYELRIPIDMLRAGTTLYRESAVVARSGYTIAVEMNGQRFYPVGVAGTLTSGGGSERERFDFTLGVDSDGDGLPDVWEEWQLSQCNIPPGPNGYDLSLLSRNGDLDKDGVSDYDEYIQGTYACDGASRMFLRFDNPTRLEFDAVLGRTYTIERSTNLLNWAAVPFSIGSPNYPNLVYVALATETVSAFVTPGPDRVFYRLVIR